MARVQACEVPVRITATCCAMMLGFAFYSPAGATVVRFQTNLGTVDVRLFEAIAPISTDNLLDYVSTDSYDGSFIHRSPPGFVVQGGGFRLTSQLEQIPTNDPIPNEPNLLNVRGTIAYAKPQNGLPTSQWFFNLRDNSFLNDQDFTVFGRVVGNGLSTLDTINALPLVNAGAPFAELPVLDIDKINDQGGTVFADDLVVVESVFELSIPDGDYNFDGTVDSADYQIWMNTLGSRGDDPTGDVRADGNGNGVVDLADYTIWRNNLGATALAGLGANVTAVPEPTSACLVALAAGVLWLARKKSGPRMSRTLADR